MANNITVKVTTYDADIEFETQTKIFGKELFNLVCTTFGIRESWYFGLQCIENSAVCSTNGYHLSWWLKMDKKIAETIRSHSCQTHDSGHHIHFLFHVKFWVEDVLQDILLEATQHLFYLEVRELLIRRQDWFCPIELAILLASYIAQVEYGDIDLLTVIEEGALLKFLPQKLLGQCQLDIKAWEDKIKDHYSDHIGITKIEAEAEILKLAQDLDMFGVSYFQILSEGAKASNGNWIGVCCFGLNFYEQDNKLKPVRQYGWNEIKNVSYKDRKFTVVINEHSREPSCFGDGNSSAPPLHFWTITSSESKQVLELCVGNHELFTRRRMPENLERQQMRVSAAAEAERRKSERRGRDRAMAAEAAAAELRAALLQSEAAVGSLAERTRHTERELRQLIENQEQQLSQMHYIQNQLLSDKLIMSERVRKFESAIMALSEEASVGEAEKDALKRQLELSKKGELSLQEKLQSFLSSPGIWYSGDRSSYELSCNNNNYSVGLVLRSQEPAIPKEFEDMPMDQLVAELESNRRDFNSRCAKFDQELKELRNKIHNYRISERAATAAFKRLDVESIASLYPLSLDSSAF